VVEHLNRCVGAIAIMLKAVAEVAAAMGEAQVALPEMPNWVSEGQGYLDSSVGTIGAPFRSERRWLE